MAQPNPTPPLPRSRRVAFAALAVALPVLAVLGLEGALRLAGVGAERRAPFVPVPEHPDHVALSPAFGASFFRGFTPGVAFDPLDAVRTPGALRVVALGGSSTAGFPYHFYYGFPARLEDRLVAMQPGRPVEVANLGMTATNSYTVWALAPSVAALQPSAVVVYAGHNEYYGAFGTGGTQGWGGTSIPLKRFGLRASRWATVAAASGLLAGDGEPPDASRTLMARVVRESAIALDGELYRAGVAQYEANLRDAIETFGQSGTPVFLGTLASNLADQAPLGDAPAAAEAFAEGRRRLAAGDTAAARDAFLEAKELDGLRFRAPEAMNGVVRRLAAEYSHVTLVDVAARIREASPGGLEGAALFADHLHPNARGYALVADAFAEALQAHLPTLEDALAPGPSPSAVDPLEADFAALQIAALTSGYPFDKGRTPDEAAALARARADSLVAAGGTAAMAARVALGTAPPPQALNAAVTQARSDADTLGALRLYGALLRWQPFNARLQATATGYALDAPRYDAETAPLARYAATHAAEAFGLNALAAIALRSGDLDRAGPLLDAAEAATPEAPEVLFNRARLLVLQGDTAAAQGYFERFQATQR